MEKLEKHKPIGRAVSALLNFPSKITSRAASS